MKELPKAYDSGKYEDDIYRRWEESGFFNPDVCIEKGKTDEDAPTFSVTLPPPNVTGTLHIGHAVMLAVEDVMIRYHRMKGDRTLWVPGTDHAAIATQEKVEKIMWNEEKLTRHDLGREKFLERVDQFAKDSHDTIVNQARRMGASLDWSREYYSLDENLNHAVRTAFKRMYDDGLIYRGDRIVNWDPKMQSNVSNIEVVRVEEKAPFYYLQYGPFEIGTARPETKFGDKYVVMHPDDNRYTEYKHGDTFECEWIHGKITATVIKDEAVDPEFGSGVMTITPWHDVNDFYIAERHGLDKEQIIDFDGKLMEVAGEFAGMELMEARAAMIKKLKEKGLVNRIDEDYVHNLATNSRGGGVIEPQIMKQWWVDVDQEFTMKHSEIDGIKAGEKTTIQKISQHVVRSKQIKILPEHFEKNYFNWVDNYLDWCLSRQLWFGHRVPAWYRKLDKGITISLFRHSESEANASNVFAGHGDFPLTEKGKNDAREWAETIDPTSYDAVFSSDLSRAFQTAKILFEERGVRVEQTELLREVDFGEKTGKGRGEVDHLRSVGFPGGEQYQDVRDRFVTFLKQIVDEYDGKHIAIVAHSGQWKILEHLVNERRLDQELLTQSAERKELKYTIKKITHVGVEPPEGEGSSSADASADTWEQDPDTLDTWFSAGLFTFSPLGWPGEDAKDFEDYHPTSVLETGYDILTFWVIRMVLMSTYHLGDVPFKTVYLHGLVRDEQGRKMSKSLGNIINPLDVCDTYGTDAVRLSLLIGATPGNDSRLSEEKIAGYRNFANKLWNIARFMTMQMEDGFVPDGKTPEAKTLSDKWILSRLSAVVAQVTDDIEQYRFSAAGELLRDFTWTELADWYLEIAKIEGSKSSILNYILQTILKLWHPYMPFVTEVLWGQIYGEGRMLMVEAWPAAGESVKDTEKNFAVLQSVIVGIRSLRAENKIAPGKKLNVQTDGGSYAALLKENVEVVKGLARLESFEIVSKVEKTDTMVSFVESGMEVFIDLDGAVDLEADRARLERELEDAKKYMASLEKKLSNTAFVSKAPAAVVEKEQKKLVDVGEKVEKLERQLTS